MAHEELFLQMAVCEVKKPQSDPHLAGLEAQSTLGGGIGMMSHTREEFIENGLEWLDGFSERVAEVRAAIEERRAGDEEPDDEEENTGSSEYQELGLPTYAEALEAEFRRLLSLAPEVDRERFAALLGEDWDERHCQEDEGCVEWHEQNDAGTEAHAELNSFYLRVSQYEEPSLSKGRWYWGVRDKTLFEIHQSGIEDTREEAEARCLEWVTKGFKAIRLAKAVEVQEEIAKLFKVLKEVAPDSLEATAGYRAGYQAGVEAAKAAIAGL